MVKVDQIIDEWVASPPTTYFQLRQAIEDPDSSFQDFSRIISSDPGLTARLLKVVNSPFYGASSQIETIQHALTIVGVDQLSELVLATAVMRNFKGIPKSLVDMDSFWSHSISCGLASRIIAAHLGNPEVDRFNVAGMLHDLGSLVIYKKAPAQAEKALTLSKARKGYLIEAEREVMGFDHADVGASLLKAWKLPERLVEVVLFHHQPSRAKKFPEDVSVIHLADILVHQMGLGTNGERMIPPLDKKIPEKLRFSKETLTSIKTELEKVFQDTISMFLSEA